MSLSLVLVGLCLSVYCVCDYRFAIKTQLCPKDNEFHNVLREVRFLRACRHPCIIDVHDAFLMTNPRYAMHSALSVLQS